LPWFSNRTLLPSQTPTHSTGQLCSQVGNYKRVAAHPYNLTTPSDHVLQYIKIPHSQCFTTRCSKGSNHCFELSSAWLKIITRLFLFLLKWHACSFVFENKIPSSRIERRRENI
jgi:hypothetical protein